MPCSKRSLQQIMVRRSVHELEAFGHNRNRLSFCCAAAPEIAPLGAGDQLRLASLWPASTPSAPQTPHPAVVRVIATDRNSMSLGSGTLVDANDDYGLVISNWHVVRDAVGPIEVVFPDGFHSMARVVRTDREWDLAALLIWKPPVQPVPVTTAAPRPGEILTIAGYGHGDYKAQSGACTQYLAPAPGRPLEIVEVAAAARHGDSGGPMFNSRGELAGVLFGEGGGRTDGSYGGRVHKFLELAANDLRTLPPTNLAKNNSVPGVATKQSAPGGGIAASNSRVASRRQTILPARRLGIQRRKIASPVVPYMASRPELPRPDVRLPSLAMLGQRQESLQPERHPKPFSSGGTNSNRFWPPSASRRFC